MISIVDDDVCSRGGMEGLLRSLGYVAVTFASAEDFLGSNYVNDTSCLITDVHMPGLSGVELHRRLLDDGFAAPTIFVSGLADETIRSEAPTRLPEARRAVQAGKLPRQAGLIFVRHDQQYELTLQAETLAISGAKLPEAEAGEERARLEERVSQMRHLVETLDLLYGAFLARRLAAGWGEELGRVQQWLKRDQPERLAEAG